MVDINRLLQTTSAGQMAQKLDAADGETDGKIKGSVWNQFVQGTGGKTINENGSISIVNAMKSICTYVVRNMHSQNKKESEIVEEYNTKIDNLSGSASASGTANANGASNSNAIGSANSSGNAAPEAPSASDNTKGTDKTSIPTSQEIKVNVTNENKIAAAKIAKEFGSAYNTGKMYFEKLKAIKAALGKITPENVAYFVEKYPNIAELIDDVDFFGKGFDKKEVYEYIMLPLTQRAEKLGLTKYANGLTPTKQAEQIQDNLEKMKAQIKYLKDWIIKKDTKIQQTFDNANKTLIDAANNKTSLKISKGDTWKSAELSDGRWIGVYYDNNGKIKNISISFDKTPNRKSDGTTFDGAEIYYAEDCAWYDNDKSNDVFEENITSGYDFEKLKAIAESIFGE